MRSDSSHNERDRFIGTGKKGSFTVNTTFQDKLGYIESGINLTSLFDSNEDKPVRTTLSRTRSMDESPTRTTFEPNTRRTKLLAHRYCLFEKAMLRMMSLNSCVTFDCPLDELRHEIVAIFCPDAHQHGSPVFQWDATRRILYKVRSVPIQQQVSAYPVFVFHGLVRKTLDLLQCSVSMAKKLHNLAADR